MKAIPRIVITPGEPAGIGPDITLAQAQHHFNAELIAIADPMLLADRAKKLNLPIEILPVDLNNPPAINHPRTLKVLPVALKGPVIMGELNQANAAYTLETLQLAADLCLQKKVSAVVTGPVHKAIMNAAGIPFLGHTEFFKACANVPQTVMLFVVNHLKVALATTHLPLKAVSAALTSEHLRNVLSVLRAGLQKQFNIENPRILACGLNPHAGEGGYLGREEIEVMQPLFEKLRQEGFRIEGPLPADTIFTPAHLAKADVILAMYHDQGLPLVKYIGFGHAVNVTLGLPFIRTSVDHGTALDIAGTGQADALSLTTAVKLAIELAHKAVGEEQE